MFRFLFYLLLIVVGIGATIWFSAQSLPNWYQDDHQQATLVAQNLSKKIERQGIGGFLGSKFADVMSGELTLTEDEFNALVLASLRKRKDGRRLLSVSDAIHAELKNDRIELGIVVNFDKMAKADAKSKKVFDQAMDLIPFKPDQKLFVSIEGTPIAVAGGIAFKPDFSVNLGSIPISSSLLQNLGVPVEKASQEVLPLRYLTIKAIETREDEIFLGVRPNF